MSIKSVLVSLALVLAAGVASAQDTVVYHVDNTAAQGLKGLRTFATTSTPTRQRRSPSSRTRMASTC
jgi:hypothetical protein